MPQWGRQRRAEEDGTRKLEGKDDVGRGDEARSPAT
jgi:hypothetical protein